LRLGVFLPASLDCSTGASAVGVLAFSFARHFVGLLIVAGELRGWRLVSL
jgi:hypothetical protein